MMQKAVNNARVLYRLGILREDVEEAHKIFKKTPILLHTLENPVVPEKKKEVLIEQIAQKSGMPKLLENFMKEMCRIGQIGQIMDIFHCYYEYWDEKNQILRAQVIFAGAEEEGQEKEIQEQLERLYPGKTILITSQTDPSLLGGYVIRVKYKEYDHSYEGRLRRLERKLTGR